LQEKLFPFQEEKALIIDDSIQLPLYPIRPRHIAAFIDWCFPNAFGGDRGKGISAVLIVRLCQEKGGWFPFTQEEIDASSRHNFDFNGLTGYDNQDDRFKHVVQGEDDKFRVTHMFICTCFQASPVEPHQF
jgi:hypothetical protein